MLGRRPSPARPHGPPDRRCPGRSSTSPVWTPIRTGSPIPAVASRIDAAHRIAPSALARVTLCPGSGVRVAALPLTDQWVACCALVAGRASPIGCSCIGGTCVPVVCSQAVVACDHLYRHAPRKQIVPTVRRGRDRPPVSRFLQIKRSWSRHSDLNRGPAVYETAALPLSYVGAARL